LERVLLKKRSHRSIFVISIFGMIFLCYILRLCRLYYGQEAKALKNLTAFCSPSQAKQIGLQGFLDLRQAENLDVWLLLREKLLSAHQFDSAFKTIHITYQYIIVPTVVLIILLIVVMFVRIIFFAKDFDIFTALGVFDVCVCSLYIFVLVRHLVDCNEVAFQEHVGVLEQVRWKTVHQISTTKSRRQLVQLSNANLLLGSAIENLKNLTRPLTVFGLVVDQGLILQFTSLAAAGAITGLTKIVGIS